MNSTRYVHIVKHVVYTLLLLLLYILQTVPGLFVLCGVKPVLVVPAAIAIAMMEGEFIGGIYGALAGIFCDIGGFSLFGFHGFFICLSAVCVGLTVIYLMHSNLRSCLLFVFVTMFACKNLEYLFAFGMWGFESAWKIYAYRVLFTVAYTTAAAAPIYYLTRLLYRRLAVALGD